MKKVLFFGIYDPGYARNRVLRLGFERNGWVVEECRADPTVYRGMAKYVVLARMGLLARRKKYDLVIVCFPGHTLVWLARLLFGPRIIFDAFLSLYDSNVFDRKAYDKNSLWARRDFLLDAWGCRLAARVLLDTSEHISYFVRTFSIPREKFMRAWIGADNEMFYPIDMPRPQICTVHFHGTFIPLQGIEHIVEAASIVRDESIRFRIVGSGQEGPNIDALIATRGLTNIERIAKVPVSRIPLYMAEADIVLGIFGATAKARRVIPNKVYEALAMRKAVITADTPAIRELPGAEEAMMLVPAEPHALARAIRSLRDSPDERARLATAGYRLFETECTPEKVVAGIVRELRL